MARFERRRTRLGRGNRIAVVTAGLALLAAAVAAAGLVSSLMQGQAAGLRAATREVDEVIGRNVAQTLERALGYGIPLDRLYAVEPFLDQVLRDNGDVAALEVQDAAGAVLYAATRDAGLADEEAPIVLDLAQDGAVVGALVVRASERRLLSARLDVWHAVTAAVLGAALLAGLAARLLAFELIELPLLRLRAAAAAIGRGVLAAVPAPPRSSPLVTIARGFERLLAPVQERWRQVLAHAEELRAVDFDGSFGSRLDAAVAMAGSRFRFRPQARPQRDAARWAGWWLLPLLLGYGASRQLAASFAYDRVYVGRLAHLDVGLALAAELLGALVVLTVTQRLRRPLRREIPLVALLTAGAALAAVALARDYLGFVALRCVAATAISLVLVACATQHGQSLRRPLVPVAVITGLEALGPAMGDLLAELVGRRIGFVVAGAAVALSALLAAPHLPRVSAGRLAGLPRRTLPLAERLPLAILAAATAAFLLLHLPTSEFRYDYAFLGLVSTSFGVCLLAGWMSGIRRMWPLLALALVGLVTAASRADATTSAAVLGSLALGLTAGGALGRLGPRLWTAGGLRTWLFGGLVGCLGAGAFLSWWPGTPAGLLVPVALALSALALAILGRRKVT